MLPTHSPIPFLFANEISFELEALTDSHAARQLPFSIWSCEEPLMNSATTANNPLRSALIRECAAEFAPRLAILMEVTRVYWHALRCPQCAKFADPIGEVSLTVARLVGSTMQGWRTLGLRFDEIVRRATPGVVALLNACQAADELAQYSESRTDWFLALQLAGLGAAQREDLLEDCPIDAAS
jgi:hypothetical protein